MLNNISFFVRWALGKFLAWSFISVIDLQTLSCLVSFKKSYLSSMLWRNFHEDIIMKTQEIFFVNTCTVCILETQNFSGKYNILPFEKCAEHLQ